MMQSESELQSKAPLYEDILIDVGTADSFYTGGQLLPEVRTVCTLYYDYGLLSVRSFIYTANCVLYIICRTYENILYLYFVVLFYLVHHIYF